MRAWYSPWYADVVQCPSRRTQGKDPNRPKGLANGEQRSRSWAEYRFVARCLRGPRIRRQRGGARARGASKEANE